jgi:hypothetical protein
LATDQRKCDHATWRRKCNRQQRWDCRAVTKHHVICHSDSEQQSNPNAYTNTDSNAYSDGNTDPTAHAGSNSNTDTNGYCNTDAISHSITIGSKCADQFAGVSCDAIANRSDLDRQLNQ